MKIFKPAFVAVAAAFVSAMPASAVIDNPITLAVIMTYDKQLAKNPKDYMIWFKRANEYYRHNEYAKALDDVNNALAYAPARDADLRFQAYLLRAGIYDQTDRKQQALSDLNSALALTPDSYAALYQKANTEFELGMTEQARTDYQKLQNLNTRSVEAPLGLARCAMADNNLSAANDYLAQAVELDKNRPEVYVRRANVRKQMGDHNGAVEDLLVALSLDSTDDKAIASLVEYGNTHYANTILGLTNAVNLAPDNGLFRYLRAMIAEAHFNYLPAVDDFNYIIDKRLYNYHGLNASLARCLYGLGRYQEALDQINDAIGAEANSADYYVVKSRIQRAMGNSEDAIFNAAKALAINHENADALSEMALNYIDKKQYRQADGLLAEALMSTPDDASLTMLRSWLHTNFLKDRAGAERFDRQVADNDVYADGDVKSLRGFALLDLGRLPEADAWMDNIIAASPDTDGEVNYYGACYYALRGNDDKALDCVERSVKKGYANRHNWLVNKDGAINVKSLRGNLRFERAVK